MRGMKRGDHATGWSIHLNRMHEEVGIESRYREYWAAVMMSPTGEEIELLHEKELMLRNRRRCMSFRIERPDFREAWGMDSDDDDADQNFISEPGSPRAKEMLHNPYFLTRMHALNRVY